MKKIDVFIAQKIINIFDKYKKLREKPVITRAAWADIIKGRDKIVYDIANGLKINLYGDSMLSELIYDNFEQMEETFITTYLKEGDIYFDIGANIGFHSLNAASVLKGNGHIYAFEPTQRTYNRLQENVTLNKLEDTISALQIGLSDVNTTLKLNISDGFDACNSFADLKYIPVNSHIDVSVFTTAHIVAQENITVKDIALIKLDVEGWEINVLKGMAPLFEMPEFAPCFLVEFTEENMFRAGYSCRELFNLIKSKGYEWYNYNHVNNTITVAELKAYYPHENLVASKNVEELTMRLKK